MTKLLMDERPLLVLPSLARRFGVNAGIVLQQLHWSLEHRDSRVVELDGRKWFRASIEDWLTEMPWLTDATIRRTFEALRTQGVILTKRGAEGNVYTIIYDQLESDGSAQSERNERSHRADESLTLSDPISTKTEKTVKTSSATEPVAGDAETLFPVDASPEPTPAKSDEELEKVERIWQHFEKAFQGRVRLGLTERREKMLRKGLKAVDGDEAICHQAVEGFAHWYTTRSSPPPRFDLGMIFETGPKDTKNLTDKIVGWADSSPTVSSSERHDIPSVLRDRVRRRRLQIVEALQSPHLSGAQERAEDAKRWLREHAHEEPVIEGSKVIEWRRIP